MSRKIAFLVAVLSASTALYIAGCGSSSSSSNNPAASNAPTINKNNPVSISSAADATVATSSSLSVATSAKGISGASSLLGSKTFKLMKRVAKASPATISGDMSSSECPGGGTAKYSLDYGNGSSYSFTITYAACSDKAGSYAYTVTDGTVTGSSSDSLNMTVTAKTTVNEYSSSGILNGIEISDLSMTGSYSGSTYNATMTGTFSSEDKVASPNIKLEEGVSNLRLTLTEGTSSTSYAITSGAFSEKKTEGGVQKYSRSISYDNFVYKWSYSNTGTWSIDGTFAINNNPDACKRNGTYILKTDIPIAWDYSAGKITLNNGAAVVIFNSDKTVTVQIGSGSQNYTSYGAFETAAAKQCTELNL